MRVLHLSSTDVEGGAARGAFWLHKALLETGVDSQMLVDRARTNDPTVVAPRGQVAHVIRGLRARIDPLPLAYYRKTNDSYWTLGWVPSGIGQRIRRIEPDIVHIHWTGVGFLPVDALKRLHCPVVWTLRDMWAFTGGCHYTAQCERYRTGCGTCPQLRSETEHDVSRWNWQRKKRPLARRQYLAGSDQQLASDLRAHQPAVRAPPHRGHPERARRQPVPSVPQVDGAPRAWRRPGQEAHPVWRGRGDTIRERASVIFAGRSERSPAAVGEAASSFWSLAGIGRQMHRMSASRSVSGSPGQR